MRVVHIMLSKDLGGAEKSYIEIVNNLAQENLKILAIGVKGGKAKQYLHENRNILVKTVFCLNSHDYLAFIQLLFKVKAFNPDLIHCHLARATKFGGIIGKILSIPVVSKTHNLVNPKYYHNTSKIVVTTEAQRTHMLCQGFEKERLTKIPNFSSFDDKITDQFRAKGKTEQNSFVIKTLGRFVKKKGFDNLIKAIVYLRDRGGAISLHIAGSGPEKISLLKIINESKHNDEIQLHEWIDDVRTFLSNADLFVLPSLDEPFGLVILDAMSAGVPILSTKTQGPLEILSTETCYFLDAPNKVEIAKKIELIIKDPLRFEKAAKAGQVFKAKYSAEAVVPLYHKLYKDILAY